jgi:hypothetical protein
VNPAAEPTGEQGDQDAQGGRTRNEERPTLRRLRRGHVLAWVAAVVLLFAMALDWYTDAQGVDARRTESIYAPQPGRSDEIGGPIREDATIAAEEHEQNAFQADALLDRLILLGLLATAMLAVAAGVLQAFGRRFEPPVTPSGLAAVVGALTGVLLLFRIVIQQPGLDAATEIKFGAVLSLAVLALVVLGAADALRNEEARATDEGTGSERDPASPARNAPPWREDGPATSE